MAVVGHIIKDTHLDIMIEFETRHAYHYFQPLLLCNPPLERGCIDSITLFQSFTVQSLQALAQPNELYDNQQIEEGI